MNVVYVCKAVDSASPTVATQVRWIASLASKPQIGRILVLTRRLGRAALPPNVEVRTFGPSGPADQSASWPAIVSGFLRQASRLRPRDVDFFFVAQGGPYPALLLPHKTAMRRPLYQWKAQPHVSARMGFYARRCDDLIFTATPRSFPAEVKPGKVLAVGHGIDTELFHPAVGPGEPRRDLVAIGRVSPIKRLDVVIRSLAACRQRSGVAPTLDIVGPSGDLRHDLEGLAQELAVDGSVRFLGSVEHDAVPALLGRYRAMVNFSDTAFDKAAGEAMACGLPVVTTNPCTSEMLPRDLTAALTAARDDPADQARALTAVLAWDDHTRELHGRRLRDTIVADHGLDTLFDKILAAIAIDRAGPQPARP